MAKNIFNSECILEAILFSMKLLSCFFRSKVTRDKFPKFAADWFTKLSQDEETKSEPQKPVDGRENSLKEPNFPSADQETTTLVKNPNAEQLGQSALGGAGATPDDQNGSVVDSQDPQSSLLGSLQLPSTADFTTVQGTNKCNLRMSVAYR